MIGVTVANNSYYFGMAQAAAKSVAKYANIPTLILTNGKDKHPKWWKHELFEYFPNQTIFYFDADTVMLQQVDLSQFEDQEEFIAVHDQHIEGHEDLKFNNFDAKLYFNTGVMIFNQRHKEITNWINDKKLNSPLKTGFVDQTYWNRAVKELKIPMRLLDAKWNTLRYQPRMRKDIIIGHYSYHDNREGQRQRISVQRQVLGHD